MAATIAYLIRFVPEEANSPLRHLRDIEKWENIGTSSNDVRIDVVACFIIRELMMCGIISHDQISHRCPEKRSELVIM